MICRLNFTPAQVINSWIEGKLRGQSSDWAIDILIEVCLLLPGLRNQHDSKRKFRGYGMTQQGTESWIAKIQNIRGDPKVRAHAISTGMQIGPRWPRQWTTLESAKTRTPYCTKSKNVTAQSVLFSNSLLHSMNALDINVELDVAWVKWAHEEHHTASSQHK